MIQKKKNSKKLDMLEIYRSAIRKVWKINPNTKIKPNKKKKSRMKQKQEFRKRLKEEN